jgi:hypothetical protein
MGIILRGSWGSYIPPTHGSPNPYGCPTRMGPKWLRNMRDSVMNWVVSYSLIRATKYCRREEVDNSYLLFRYTCCIS